MLTKTGKIILGVIIAACGLPVLLPIAGLLFFLAKPYSGLCLCLGLPAMGVGMLLLTFWKNPPTFGIFKANPRHPRSKQGESPIGYRFRAHGLDDAIE